MTRAAVLALVLVLVAAACSDDSPAAVSEAASTTSTNPTDASAADPVDSNGAAIPPAPTAPTGPLDDSVVADLDLLFGTLRDSVSLEAVDRIGASGDPRLAWLLADLLRFIQGGIAWEVIVAAFERLTGTEVTELFAWGQVTDWLIAWDLPAPPGYVAWKSQLFELVEPAWADFFADPDSDVDWRWVSWGGVLIDDRPIEFTDSPCPEGCIPALDDPGVTDAAGGGWYPDDSVVFGVVLNGEARAYPKNIMEVHEMVNDTIGGRRVGIPYCTLCGSAQAYLIDDVAGFDTLELRTSGLLTRSNKVTYEFHTRSVIDTFTGVALSGPLHDAGVELEPVTVLTSTWRDWKTAHPDTTIVAQDGGIGRVYPEDPLRGRDAAGPIFPVGDVDPRLPVQEPVLGVIAPDGTTVAFPVEEATRALADGGEVVFGEVRVTSDGAGLTAETLDGDPITTHQAFWFAWSQFHPGTAVWSSVGL